MLRPWWLVCLLVCLLGAVPWTASACTTTQGPSSTTGPSQHFLYDVTDNGQVILTVDSGIDVGRHRQPRCISASAVGVLPDPDPQTEGRYFVWGATTFDLPTRTAYEGDPSLAVYRASQSLLVQGDRAVRSLDLDTGDVGVVANTTSMHAAHLAQDGDPVLASIQPEEYVGPLRVSVLDAARGWLLQDVPLADVVGPVDSATLESARGDWMLFRTMTGGARAFVAFEMQAGVHHAVPAPNGTTWGTLSGDEVLFVHDGGANGTYVHLRTGATRTHPTTGSTPFHTYDVVVRTGAPSGPHGWRTIDLRTMSPPASTSSTTVCCPTTTTLRGNDTAPRDDGPGDGDDILEVPLPALLAVAAPVLAAWAIRRRL